MNALVPTASSGSSTQRLARLLKRAECVWMASPSVALLSVFVGGKARPARLLVGEGSPSFVGNIGRIAGAVPETVPLASGDQLRAALLALGPSSARSWGVATHREGALVPREWFEAFDRSGVPTVELCMGGLFQLARRGTPVATFTIVSLDDEPAFEGAQLTALLTSDPVLAQRVRELCLVGPGTDDYILDATPRGLAEDESALSTVIERAIAREEAEWAAPQTANVKTLGSGRIVSRALKRFFQSDSSEPTETVPEGLELTALPPPRGRNSWLARLGEAEDRYRLALDQHNATLETVRAQSSEREAQGQTVIDEWKHRFEEAESKSAARVEELRAEIEEAERRSAEHEKNLVAQEERESRNTEDWEASRGTLSERIANLEGSASQAEEHAAVLQKEKEDLHEALALANHTHDALAQKLEQIEQEYEAASVEAREREEALRSQSRDEQIAAEASLRSAQEIEKARNEALARITGLEGQISQLTSRSAATVIERDEVAALLLRSEEAHREALRLADERTASTERERAEETARLNAEWQARFGAATDASIKETQRLEANHAGLLAQFQDEVDRLRKEAESAAKDHATELASVTERNSLLEEEKATLRKERDEALVRIRQAEERFGETVRVAEQRTATVQREKEEEASRLNATVTQWQARCDVAAEAAATELRRLEASHAMLAARLQKEVDQLKQEREAAAEELRRLEASHAMLAARLQEEVDQLKQEREVAAEEVQRLEVSHAMLAARLQEEVDRLKQQRDAAAQGHERESAALAERVSRLTAEKINVTDEYSRLEGRLRQTEEKHGESLRLAEERTAAVRSENAVEASNLNATIVALQSQLDAATKGATEESQRLETHHGTVVEGLQKELRKVREEAEAAARDHVRGAATLAERLKVFERGTAAALAERNGVEARLRQVEESHREAMGLAEDRLAEADVRLRSADARLVATTETWKAISEGAGQARVLESAGYAEAISAWQAHRATLEARIAKLEQVAASPESEESRPNGVIGPLATDPPIDVSGVRPVDTDQETRPKAPWERERVSKDNREGGSSAVEDWSPDF